MRWTIGTGILLLLLTTGVSAEDELVEPWDRLAHQVAGAFAAGGADAVETRATPGEPGHHRSLPRRGAAPAAPCPRHPGRAAAPEPGARRGRGVGNRGDEAPGRQAPAEARGHLAQARTHCTGRPRAPA